MKPRICPECQKAFYPPPDERGVLCSHCGHILYEARDGTRVRPSNRSLSFTLTLPGAQVEASIKDYSPSGLRITYSGAEMDIDSILNVDIDELGIHAPARAVWTKRISSSSFSAGLRLLN